MSAVFQQIERRDSGPSVRFSRDDRIAAHEEAFTCGDLCECVDEAVLEALRNGDEAEAGHILHRNMRGLISARAAYDGSDS